jgi:hypothetical protein
VERAHTAREQLGREQQLGKGGAEAVVGANEADASEDQNLDDHEELHREQHAHGEEFGRRA